jgi:hypothetical protein
MGLDHRGPYIAVTEKHLDGADVIIGLQKVSGKAVAEGIIERTYRSPHSSGIPRKSIQNNS